MRKVRHQAQPIAPTGAGASAAATTRRRLARSAFTLIEAMIGTAILAMSVLALSSAIGAGQKSSIEGQKVVLASMTLADLLSEISTASYSNLASYNGRSEAPGAMTAIDGAPYPKTFWMLGRTVSVTDHTVSEPGLGVVIKGKRILVRAVDDTRIVASAEVFVPEPGS